MAPVMREVRKPRHTFKDRVSSLIDSSIGFFSPTAEAKRRFARKQVELATYRGAENDGINTNWMDRVMSADAVNLPDLETLRQRSRELNRDDTDAAALTQALVDNVVGSGSKPQSMPDRRLLLEAGVSEEEINRFTVSVERAWRVWADREADAGNRLSFYGIQRQAFRQIVECGETFAHLVLLDESADPYRRYSLTCELIEPDRITEPAAGFTPRPDTRNGITLGDRGQPVSYQVQKFHPGDEERFKDFNTGENRDYFTVQAVDELGEPRMLHVFHQDRPGQTRGVPFFAPCIEMFRLHGDLKEALVVSAQARACFVAFITKNEILEPYTNKKTDSMGNRIDELAPGLVQYLSPGESVSFGDPSAAAPETKDFSRQILRSIGAALGIPYEAGFKDFSDTNYTAGRAATLEFQRTINRHRDLLNRFNGPVWWRFVDEAWARGELGDVPMFRELRHAWSSVRWVPPARGWVDPLKEIQAAQLAVESNLSSLPADVAAQGGDWEENIETAARVQTKREKEGLQVAPAVSSSPGEDRDTATGDDEDE